MTYCYWYVPTSMTKFGFGDPQTDIIDLGPLPLTIDQALIKISNIGRTLGRHVLRVKRVRGY